MDILDLSLKKYITWENGYNLGESGIRSSTSGEVSSYIPVNEDEIIQYKTITRETGRQLHSMIKIRILLAV